MSPISYDPRAFARHAQATAIAAARAKLVKHHCDLTITDIVAAAISAAVFGSIVWFFG